MSVQAKGNWRLKIERTSSQNEEYRQVGISDYVNCGLLYVDGIYVIVFKNVCENSIKRVDTTQGILGAVIYHDRGKWNKNIFRGKEFNQKTCGVRDKITLQIHGVDTRLVNGRELRSDSLPVIVNCRNFAPYRLNLSLNEKVIYKTNGYFAIGQYGNQ